MRRTFTAEAGESVRLDVYLTAETEVTRSQIKKLVDEGRITVNGDSTKAAYIVRAGDRIEADFPEPVTELVPKEMPLDVLYEDEEIVVLNKPQGLTVHPAAGNLTDTLVNGLLFRYGTLSAMESTRPGIVHRLDKDTSGVMVVARTDRAHTALAEQFALRTADKRYRAVLSGNLKNDSGTLTTFIGRDPADRKAMAVTEEGRVAITGYRVLERFKQHCSVEFTLYTGRTHQIRVHAKFLRCPVTCDPVYGFAEKQFPHRGQLLHAYHLAFDHPATGSRVHFTAPLPDYFEAAIAKLRKKEGTKACDSKID